MYDIYTKIENAIAGLTETVEFYSINFDTIYSVLWVSIFSNIMLIVDALEIT